MADTLLPAILSPGVLLILAGLVAGSVPEKNTRAIISLAAVAVAITHLLSYGTAPMGSPVLYGESSFLGLDIIPVRIDKLSVIFSFIFLIAAGLNAIYGWLHATRIEVAMGLIYAGAAVCGALAGDFLTLFVFWELAALSSVFIVWAAGNHAAFKAGMRYLVVQVLSGLILITGVAMRIADGQGTFFGELSLYSEDGALILSSLFILIAFGIKAAFPLLHNWLQDSYPKATAVGAVMLSAFTTKLAVYTLARSFAGTEVLIYIGAVMTVFPVFFALIENDLRKVLAYSLNNQVGFMVCAVGIGTNLAINGAAAHAFVHIIYKALLFMSMGAVLVRVGSTKATDLGGLHKSMPWTTIFCIIGAMSISAFPLFSGFVAKSLIVSAAVKYEYFLIWFVLIFASAGVLEHSGIKIPYFAFFAHDQFSPKKTGKPRPKEAPLPMLVAMFIAAALCIGVGVFPSLLYGLLPYEVKYEPYTVDHVVTQMQLLLFAILAFALLVKFKLYPDEVRSTNLDTDWFFRVPGYKALMGVVGFAVALWRGVWGTTQTVIGGITAGLYRSHGPEGALSRSWPVGFMALFTAIVLGFMLIVTFLFG
jgi:multicomponent Na+:H+ antiporter subunit D